MIKLASQQISAIYLGATQISRVMQGAEVAWTGMPDNAVLLEGDPINLQGDTITFTEETP